MVRTPPVCRVWCVLSYEGHPDPFRGACGSVEEGPGGVESGATVRPPAQVLDDALRGPAEQHRDALVERRLIEAPARQALLEAASGADLLVVGARPRVVHRG